VYAGDGATDAASQIGRMDPEVGAYGDAFCQPSTPPISSAPVLLTSTATTSDHTVVTVTCAWSSDPLQPDRTVTFTAFLGATPDPAKRLVEAVVIYHDGLAGGGTPAVDVISWTYCGHSTSC
jgi:hypothetical protein